MGLAEPSVAEPVDATDAGLAEPKVAGLLSQVWQDCLSHLSRKTDRPKCGWIIRAK
jgi:hypothetical protein